jgi:hypothetical protein
MSDKISCATGPQDRYMLLLTFLKFRYLYVAILCFNWALNILKKLFKYLLKVSYSLNNC